MSFEVKVSHPFDDEWQDRDRLIKAAARVEAMFGGADTVNDVRYLGFFVPTLAEAVALREAVERIDDVRAVIREE